MSVSLARHWMQHLQYRLLLAEPFVNFGVRSLWIEDPKDRVPVWSWTHWIEEPCMRVPVWGRRPWIVDPWVPVWGRRPWIADP